MQTRRTLIAAMAVSLPAASLLAGCSGKVTPVADKEELFLGKADAPVTIVEYASVACPVCAEWQISIFPDFKKKYIDSGQVKFVTREMNAHNPALSTAGYLVARCAGKEKYHDVVNDIYHAQGDMEGSGDYRGGLLKIAKAHGLSESQFDKCVNDPAAIDAQIKRVEAFAKQDSVFKTPTFVVDGQIVAEGLIGMPELDSIVASAKAKKAG